MKKELVKFRKECLEIVDEYLLNKYRTNVYMGMDYSVNVAMAYDESIKYTMDIEVVIDCVTRVEFCFYKDELSGYIKYNVKCYEKHCD